MAVKVADLLVERGGEIAPALSTQITDITVWLNAVKARALTTVTTDRGVTAYIYRAWYRQLANELAGKADKREGRRSESRTTAQLQHYREREAAYAAEVQAEIPDAAPGGPVITAWRLT